MGIKTDTGDEVEESKASPFAKNDYRDANKDGSTPKRSRSLLPSRRLSYEDEDDVNVTEFDISDDDEEVS
ncbi:MAG: hypothetical protein ACRDL7_12560, partial [Gaiellaceae bacterium]